MRKTSFQAGASNLKLQRILRVDIILLALANILGGTLRFLPVVNAKFPINDGGLFYTMTQDLITNGFRLPLFSTYNHLNLPYAYPPLGFFLTGILTRLTGWALIDIFRILPAVFTVFSIPAFYWFSKEMAKDRLQAAIATCFFACLPYTINWLIMGGGVTRAPAFLFYVITLTFINRLYTRPEKKYIVLTAVLSSLIILTHPETALYTLLTALVFFLFLGRNKQSVVRSFLVAALTLGLTSPWWITVVRTHGLSPFLHAGSMSGYYLHPLMDLLYFNHTGEQYLQLIGVLGMMGFFFSLFNKNFILPTLMVTLYFTDPRSAGRFISPILAIFAADALLVFLTYIKTSAQSNPRTERWGNIVILGISTLMGIQMIVSEYSEAYNLPRLTENEIKVFQWIKSNTTSNSKFVILTNQEPLYDAASEWFPSITGRISLATVQGHEWISEPGLMEQFNKYNQLRGCYPINTDCVESWSKVNQLKFDYLLVSTAEPIDETFYSSKYVKIFESAGFSLFRVDHTNY